MDPVVENPPSVERPTDNSARSVVQARLGLGGETLNPDNNNIAKIDSVEALRNSYQQSKDVTTNTISNASTAERTDYWNGQGTTGFDNQKRQWVEQMVAVCRDRKDVTDILQSRNLCDVSWGNFDQAAAEKLFSTYFFSQANPSNVNQFAQDVIQAYTRNGTIDYETFKRELPALEWAAHIFGNQNSFDVITNLVELQIKLQNDALAQELVNEVNVEEDVEVQGQTQKVTKLNNLADRAKQLFGFLYRHKEQQPPVQPPQPTQPTQPATQQTTPPVQPPPPEPTRVQQETVSQEPDQLANPNQVNPPVPPTEQTARPTRQVGSFNELVGNVKNEFKPDEQTITTQLDNTGLASIVPEVLEELKKKFTAGVELNIDQQNPPQAEIVNNEGTVRLIVNGKNLPVGLGDRPISLSFKLIRGTSPGTVSFVQIQSDLPFYAQGAFANLLQRINLHETLKRRTQELVGSEFQVDNLSLQFVDDTKLAVDVRGKKK